MRGSSSMAGHGRVLHGGTVRRRRTARLLAALAVYNLGLAAFLIASSYPPAPGADDAAVPDFLAFWAAARQALEGTPWLAYDRLAHKAVEIAGAGAGFRGSLEWLYPPPFQLLLMPFALLPLWPAMTLWLLCGMAAFLCVCYKILPDRLAVLGAVAAAPTLLNLVNGQTGFLIAGLVGLSLIHLERRPVISGAALAITALKPHTTFALPLALIAAGHWRSLAAATTAFALIVAASLLALGTETWSAFFANLAATSEALTGGAERRWEIHATIYTLLRLSGLDFGPAIAIHAVPAVLALWLTFRAWRAPAVNKDIRAALVCFATALATPRLLHYDLHILTIGVLFQLRHASLTGYRRGERVLIGAVLLALHVSVYEPPLLMPFAAPALFLGCLLGHARAALPGHSRSAVPSGGRSWVERG